MNPFDLLNFSSFFLSYFPIFKLLLLITDSYANDYFSNEP